MIYFLLYLFLEVMSSSAFINAYGGFYFFLEILLSMVVGGFLITNFKYAVSEKLYDLFKGELSPQELATTSIFNLLGAVFLIVPGIFTDIIGIILQFDFFIIFIKNLALKYGYLKTNKEFEQNQKRSIDEVIDVEVVDDNSGNITFKH